MNIHYIDNVESNLSSVLDMDSREKKIYYPIFRSDLYIKFLTDSGALRKQTNRTLLYCYNKYLLSSNILYNEDTIKIVIYTPSIEEKCGGVMVLHNLAKIINELNYPNIKCFLYYYNHTQQDNEFCNDFFNPNLIDDKTIVIYPETIHGNPLKAKYVIRWILLDLGFEVPKNHYINWSKNDIVYHWEPTTLKNSKQLVNIWINKEIKKYNNNKRTKNCYAMKKIKNIRNTLHSHKRLTLLHDPDNDICIDNLPIKDVVKIFNESQIFYCYDPNTFLSIMAPLCGCVTVLHPSKGVSKKQYFKSRILCKDNFCFDSGIAYGNELKEISKAFDTVENAQENFFELNSLYHETVTNFLSDITTLIENKPLINTVERIYY